MLLFNAEVSVSCYSLKKTTMRSCRLHGLALSSLIAGIGAAQRAAVWCCQKLKPFGRGSPAADGSRKPSGQRCRVYATPLVQPVEAKLLLELRTGSMPIFSGNIHIFYRFQLAVIATSTCTCVAADDDLLLYLLVEGQKM